MRVLRKLFGLYFASDIGHRLRPKKRGFFPHFAVEAFIPDADRRFLILSPRKKVFFINTGYGPHHRRKYYGSTTVYIYIYTVYVIYNMRGYYITTTTALEPRRGRNGSYWKENKNGVCNTPVVFVPSPSLYRRSFIFYFLIATPEPRKIEYLIKSRVRANSDWRAAYILRGKIEFPSGR